MYFRALLLITTSLIAACNSDVVRPVNTQPPAWFHEPDVPGYLGISVSASVQPMGGLEAQRRVALTKARAELGRINRVHVQSKNVLHQSSNNTGATTDFQNQTRLSSSEMLDVSNMEVREEWIDLANGDLYIWVLIPKKQAR